MDKRKKNPVTAPMTKKRTTFATPTAAFARERAVALCMVAINGTAVSSPPRAGGFLSEALDRTPLPTLRKARKNLAALLALYDLAIEKRAARAPKRSRR